MMNSRVIYFLIPERYRYIVTYTYNISKSSIYFFFKLLIKNCNNPVPVSPKFIIT